MLSNTRRKIYPINDANQFLEEGRVEFERLVELQLTWELSRENFDFIKLIGRGSRGRVFLAKHHSNGCYYALKLLKKDHILRKNLVNSVINEKRVLQAVNHPFIVCLQFAFQDRFYIYLGLPFVSGGELFVHLRKMKSFSEDLSRFYGAQVFLALEYLHYCGVIYRDLKPENLLLDRRGFLKLTDFGTSKQIVGRTYTFCGTPDYVAPEVVLAKSYTKAVDWWSFGVLLFEITAGYAPFHARSEVKIYKKSLNGLYKVPKYFSEDLTHLILNLLQVDVTKRFGNLKNGIDDIKQHSWFKEIDWYKLLNKIVKPPFVPTVENDRDTSNFFAVEDSNWFDQTTDTIEVKIEEL